ncbi:MAG: ABC transporter substrate-binding protein [Alphaproteobacteria bacterium]|nr:ABC transporter substrate-binding protein [Alphaproteobacteria bacterium]
MKLRLVRTAVLAVMGCLVALGANAQQVAQNAPAAAVIEKLGSVMIDTMRDAKSLGYQGRFQKLAPAILDAFDLPKMVSVAVGGAWKQMTPDQHQRIVDAFARYTVAVHASRLDGFSGETFKVVSASELPNKGGMLVKAQFVRSSGTTENIDYVLQENQQAWQIVDVFYRSSISEVATRRSEYTAVIKNSGVERLIAAMDEKTAELGSKTATN